MLGNWNQENTNESKTPQTNKQTPPNFSSFFFHETNKTCIPPEDFFFSVDYLVLYQYFVKIKIPLTHFVNYFINVSINHFHEFERNMWTVLLRKMSNQSIQPNCYSIGYCDSYAQWHNLFELY